jgi:predicted metalloprotease
MGLLGGGGLMTLVLVLVALYFGVDPSLLLQEMPAGGQTSVRTEVSGAGPEVPDTMRDFVAVVLADTEDTWQALFAAADRRYQEPSLVLFSGQVSSACGMASAAVGPFYCPGDSKVYIDLAFFADLRDRFNAPGDFAEAYVIAHEVGHHVQNLLGTSAKVQQARAGQDEAGANALSVRLELQADCYAGIWAYHADRSRQLLEAGDIEEGLAAASAIGDDRLQMQSRGYVSPDSFTHGSAEQRVRWFQKGYSSGEPGSCDSFAAALL